MAIISVEYKYKYKSTSCCLESFFFGGGGWANIKTANQESLPQKMSPRWAPADHGVLRFAVERHGQKKAEGRGRGGSRRRRHGKSLGSGEKAKRGEKFKRRL